MSLIKYIEVGGVAREIGALRSAFPDDHALAGVGAKLERARVHLETLNTEMTAFLDRKPYSFELERGRRRTEFVLRSYAKETPTLAWSTMVGDFLQNVRTALEYLVWELARAEIKRKRSSKTTPDDRTSFPIYLKRKGFDAKGWEKIQDLAPRAQEIIEAMQPYNRSYVSRFGVVNMHAVNDLNQWYRGHTLWRLNELARRDRHQALRVVGAATWGASGSSATELPGVRDSRLEFGLFEVGSVVARWVLDEAVAASIEPEGSPAPLQPSVSLVLDQKGGPGGHSVIMELGRLLEHVDSEVVPRLERFV